jgi:hypothetical protein
LFLGAVLARGRRTVTSWIRAAGLGDQFRSCYTAVAAAGKEAETVAAYLVLWVVKPLVSGAGRLTLAIDDTPTPRYGPQVEGAGVHHNPTPGPAGSPYVYGHVFVVLGLLAAHPAWGVIALPLLSRLYVRKKDLLDINPKHRPEFRTKLELAVELLRWAKLWLGLLGKPLWVVADGAYAKKEFLKPALGLGMTVVSRLHCDAALWSLPPVIPPDQKGPGRPRIYGTERISLAKRAGQRRGWKFHAYRVQRATPRRAVEAPPGACFLIYETPRRRGLGDGRPVVRRIDGHGFGALGCDGRGFRFMPTALPDRRGSVNALTKKAAIPPSRAAVRLEPG